MPGRIAIVVFAVCATAALWATKGFIQDDAHITFTYSRNLADGYGPVFNIGDRTLSTTTPLTAIAMSIPSLLGLDVQFAGILTSLAATLALAALLFVNLRPITRTVGALVAGIIVILHPFAVSSVSNEMLPYTAVAVAALHFAARRQTVPATILASLCVLIRPDGMLVLAIVAAFALLDQRDRVDGALLPEALWSVVRAPLVALALVLGPWVAFSTWYYGSPVPVTLGTKQAQLDAGLQDGFLPVVGRRLQIYLDDRLYWAAGVLLVVGLGTGVYLVGRRLPRLVSDRFRLFQMSDAGLTVGLVILWNIGYAAAYTVLGVAGYGWYAVPMVTSIGIGTAAGIATLSHAAHRWISSPHARQAAAVCLVTLVVAPLATSVSDFASRPTNRTALYPPTGNWIATHVHPDHAVGTLEVGIIGYTAHRTIIDFAGLIQPDIIETADPELGFNGLALAAWQKYSPEYVAMLRPGIPTVTSDARFQEICSVVTVIERPDVVEIMDVYDCRPN